MEGGFHSPLLLPAAPVSFGGGGDGGWEISPSFILLLFFILNFLQINGCDFEQRKEMVKVFVGRLGSLWGVFYERGEEEIGLGGRGT